MERLPARTVTVSSRWCCECRDGQQRHAERAGRVARLERHDGQWRQRGCLRGRHGKFDKGCHRRRRDRYLGTELSGTIAGGTVTMSSGGAASAVTISNGTLSACCRVARGERHDGSWRQRGCLRERHGECDEGCHRRRRDQYWALELSGTIAGGTVTVSRQGGAARCHHGQRRHAECAVERHGKCARRSVARQRGCLRGRHGKCDEGCHRRF